MSVLPPEDSPCVPTSPELPTTPYQMVFTVGFWFWITSGCGGPLSPVGLMSLAVLLMTMYESENASSPRVVALQLRIRIMFRSAFCTLLTAQSVQYPPPLQPV